MWEQTIKLPARWLTHDEALSFLGVTEGKFRRLLAARLFRTQGKGTGQRYDAETVNAVAVLLNRLEALLPPAPEKSKG